MKQMKQKGQTRAQGKKAQGFAFFALFASPLVFHEMPDFVKVN